MASANILNIPFRKSAPIALSSAVKQYIDTKYDQHPDMFAADLDTVDKLRTDAINVQEPHVSGIHKLCRYAAQLQWMSGKFPIDVGAEFSWYPALGYNTTKLVTQNNLQFERANIIYNLASLYSQLATGSPRNTAEGKKAACNYFCAAAGVLHYLKQDVITELRSTPPEDMDAMTLECLEQLMLAQAQECYWSKAVGDGAKDSTVARLAASVSDYYDRAGEFAVQSSSITSEWMHHMTAKHLHFAAAAQYRQSLACLDKGKYGEEVARLKESLEIATDALKEKRYLSKIVVQDLQDLKSKVSEVLTGAEKDNNMIYLEPIPPPSALVRITRANMANPKVPKEISEATNMLGENAPYGVPLFAKLVPFAVHLAASIYAERRDRLVNTTIIDELEASTVKLHELLQSLNLPGSLQALEKPLGLPPTLMAHAEEVRQQGGVEKLHASVQDINKLKANDIEMYQEAVEMLNKEASEDAKAREKFGTERWTRDPSRAAAGKLIDQITEYDGIIKTADNTDRLVRDKLRDFQPVLQLLSGPLHDLEEFVPNSSRATLTPKMDREVGKLRQCLNEVSRLESRRRKKVEALRQKTKADDITTAILAETGRLERENPLRKVETTDFEPLFSSRLDSRYGADKHIIDEESLEQDDIIARLRDANASFLACRRMDSSLKEREEALQKLENGYFKYRELINNLDVGRKFYNDLARLLARFREECKHFVYQRRIEASQVEVEITTAMHNIHLANTTLPSPFQPQQMENQRLPLMGPPPMQPPVSAPVPVPAPARPPIASPGLWKGDSTTAIKFAPAK